MAKGRDLQREAALNEEASSLAPTGEGEKATRPAKLSVQLPEGLGLSEDQLKSLQQKFASHFVDSSEAQGKISAAPKTVVKASPVIVEIITQ